MYTSIAAVCWAVMAFAVWAPRKYTWASNGATVAGMQVGDDERTFGWLSYLVVTREDVPIGASDWPIVGWFTSPSGRPIGYDWRRTALITSILGTVFFAAGCLMVALRAISKPLPPGQCDECGYDLRGLPDDADACPECGAGVAGQRLPAD